MKELTIVSGGKELYISCIDRDGDVMVEIYNMPESIPMYITKAMAEKIIEHLKNQFNL